MDAISIGLAAAVLISILGGWLISRSKKVEKPVMVMVFVLYFWLFVFIQLIILAVLYHFGIL